MPARLLAAAIPAALVLITLAAPPARAKAAKAAKAAKPVGERTEKADAAEDAPSPALKERIARLTLRQVAFGSVSLLPVTFESSRLAGPIEDGGRTIYCVSSHMKGRTFGKPERPKAVMRLDADRLSVIEDDEVCSGHRSKPFPELDALGNAR